MTYTPAQVTDILRCAQKDDTFIRSMQDNLQQVFSVLGLRNYNSPKFGASLNRAWYYLLTSGSNLQTLGEEYAGIVRVINSNRIPTQFVELLWIILSVCGGEIFDKILHNLTASVTNNETLTEEARGLCLKLLTFCQTNKETFRRIHHLVFLMNGNFYYIPSRFLNLRYVLVRSWMLNESFVASFRILGRISLALTIFNLGQQFYQMSLDTQGLNLSTWTLPKSVVNSKMCVLCGDLRKSPCATKCGHVFCWVCIFDCLQYQEKCPVCRESVRSSRLFPLQNYT